MLSCFPQNKKNQTIGLQIPSHFNEAPKHTRCLEVRKKSISSWLSEWLTNVNYTWRTEPLLKKLEKPETKNSIWHLIKIVPHYIVTTPNNFLKTLLQIEQQIQHILPCNSK